MSDSRMHGVRKQMNRRKECKYCTTSSGLKKINDTITRVKQRLQEVWSGRKKKS